MNFGRICLRSALVDAEDFFRYLARVSLSDSVCIYQANYMQELTRTDIILCRLLVLQQQTIL